MKKLILALIVIISAGLIFWVVSVLNNTEKMATEAEVYRHQAKEEFKQDLFKIVETQEKAVDSVKNQFEIMEAQMRQEYLNRIERRIEKEFKTLKFDPEPCNEDSLLQLLEKEQNKNEKLSNLLSAIDTAGTGIGTNF